MLEYMSGHCGSGAEEVGDALDCSPAAVSKELTVSPCCTLVLGQHAGTFEGAGAAAASASSSVLNVTEFVATAISRAHSETMRLSNWADVIHEGIIPASRWRL